MEQMKLPDKITGITDIAHAFAGAYLLPGETAVDCTAGNGHDTLFLLEKNGPDGFVYAFDIQQLAIENTRRRLFRAGISPARFTLINDSHARLDRYVKGPVSVFMFNLGYLPGGDRTITTDAPTVIHALSLSLSMLKCLGVITLVLYPGHGPGRVEQEAVLEYVAGLDQNLCRVVHIQSINTEKIPPSVLVIQKLQP